MARERRGRGRLRGGRRRLRARLHRDGRRPRPPLRLGREGRDAPLHRARAERHGRRRRAGRLRRLRVLPEREDLSRRSEGARSGARRAPSSAIRRRRRSGRSRSVRTARSTRARATRAASTGKPAGERSSSSTRSRTCTSVALLAAPDGTVYAGTSDRGLVVAIGPKGARTLHDFSRPEVTGLALRRQGRPLRRRFARWTCRSVGPSRRTPGPSRRLRPRPRPRPSDEAPKGNVSIAASTSPARPALSVSANSSEIVAIAPDGFVEPGLDVPRGGGLRAPLRPAERLAPRRDGAAGAPLRVEGPRRAPSGPDGREARRLRAGRGRRVRGGDERRSGDPAARGDARRRLVHLRREGRRAAVDVRPDPLGGRGAGGLLRRTGRPVGEQRKTRRDVVALGRGRDSPTSKPPVGPLLPVEGRSRAEREGGVARPSNASR